MNSLIVTIMMLFPLFNLGLHQKLNTRFTGAPHILFMSLVAILTLCVSLYPDSLSQDLIPGFSSYFEFNALSGLVGLTVLLIGSVVSQFSVKHLEDDPQKSQFMSRLTWIQCAILGFIMSNHLLVLWGCWLVVSYFLHTLLTHFKDRPEAQKAARQKFKISRVGDAFMLMAMSALLLSVGSLEFTTIFTQIENPQFLAEHGILLQSASLFLILGALIKSAQVPFHYWLPNTMETPTPVSALMHAGIINAGGFVIIRTSPLLVQFPGQMALMALIGGITTIYGVCVMTTQTNVKQQLAYSTIAQMGFMMLQCGLGVFTAAVLHLVGHAFYKSHAFLSSGVVAEEGKLARYYPNFQTRNLNWTHSLFGIGFALLLSLGLTLAMDAHHPGKVFLLFVLGLALSQMFLGAIHKVMSTINAGIMGGLYVGLYLILDLLLAGLYPKEVSYSGPVLLGLATVLMSGLMVLFLLQNHPHTFVQTRLGKRLYVHLLNGFYIGK